MSNAPDKFDNQQNNPDAQDRDQDLGYRRDAPKARPSEDNAFDRPGSIDRLGGEPERRPAEAVDGDEEADEPSR
ncbi:hypothetical protein E3C22_00625 [Jiella endophytica]|uniref:Uncharacterized protein n=1 Tax=Jiella endophytica TaxID=2558362 RepID=A0A4Y8RFW6_9HYPH|nr:hypothetical protein [Jiella endophytica]TFF20718.1 hypothetical protein E3C22_17665 [Jiella endophytica]TFF27019.1 hypothetical protein E3C22_00625 [Jiella endophytica]